MSGAGSNLCWDGPVRRYIGLKQVHYGPFYATFGQPNSYFQLQPTGFHLVFVKALNESRSLEPLGEQSLGGQFLARLGGVPAVLGQGSAKESGMNHPLSTAALRTRSKEAPNVQRVPVLAESSLSLAAMPPLS